MATMEGGVKKKRKLSAHQERLAAQLDGAQFRALNESLYTSTGAEAVALMRRDGGALFAKYHAGFVRQATRWPANPLDEVIRALRALPAGAAVADLGCGEARLAAELGEALEVHSFDLVAANDRVTACDMCSLPLEAASVDAAVCCLALMNTDYGGGLAEARRVLRTGGTLLVAEVGSRFEGDARQEFVKGVERLGFRHLPQHAFVRGEASSSSGAKRKGKKRRKAQDEGRSNASDRAFFLKFAFEAARGTGKVAWRDAKLPALKPCVYKRR